MPRRKRTKSESGIYHAMIRGMNKQDIFHDDEDYRRFISIIRECKDKYDFELYAYCLMTNHVHFLIKETEDSLESIFKSIGIRYAYYYNTKYKRTGSLFQDRFVSFPVEDDEYYISALRYIHNNPVKAKIISECTSYKYSSYNDYINYSGIADCAFTYSIMSKKEFIRMHGDNDLFTHPEIDMFNKIRLRDSEAEIIFSSLTDSMNKKHFNELSDAEQAKLVSLLAEHHLNKKQIASLTGLNYYKINSYI